MSGTLIVCALPIGNHSDITQRVRHCLTTVSVIAAEDTRLAKQQVSNYNRHHPPIFIRMDQYQEKRSFEQIDDYLLTQDVVYLSDAGTPGVSDPGAMLVQHCRERGVPVQCLPGASALTTFISGCGIPMSGFTFLGFLPKKTKERLDTVAQLIHNQSVGVWFESPNRMKDSLRDIACEYPTLNIVLAKELTKPYEQFYWGTAKSVSDSLQAANCRGEWVGAIDGRSIMVNNERLMSQAINYAKEWELTGTQIKAFAQLLGISKNSLYARVMCND